MNGIKNKIRKKMGVLFATVCVLCLFGLSNPEQVEASVFDNAYEFYLTYGNEMAFLHGPNLEGEIYYATSAKKVDSGTQYTTIGWKVTVLDSVGTVMDTIYYQLGGAHMTRVDVREVGGYEYCLYRVTLTNLKNRMNDAARYTLTIANANIIFDACTTTKINGEVQGSMTDAGPYAGAVYTTYEGIANAADWSDSTKISLISYYNKTVKGLFYTLSVYPGEGIDWVTGSGRYCFGTIVTVSAKPATGYHFSHWSGNLYQQNLTFALYGDISLTAVAALNQYKIIYDGNGGTGEMEPLQVSYADTVKLPNQGFERELCCISGWSTQKDVTEESFACNEEIAVSEIVQSLGLENTNNGSIRLYAVWNHAPVIEGEDIYVSLEDARAGNITESWLAEYINANDLEDGMIAYGNHESNSLLITNYSSTDFTKFEKEGYVTQTFCATDSAGNQTSKIIKVYIVDTSVYDAKIFLGQTRFISKKYYKDKNGNYMDEADGGLKKNSIWKLDLEYKKLLDHILD